MDESQQVLLYCPNFREIINCDFLEDDMLTQKLIQYYQEFVFNVNPGKKTEVDLIKQLDQAMYKYIDDYRFAKNLKETLNIETIISQNFSYLEQLMQYIINFFQQYEANKINNMVYTRWL